MVYPVRSGRVKNRACHSMVFEKSQRKDRPVLRGCWVFSQKLDMGQDLCPNLFHSLLEIINREAMATEKTDSILGRWLAPWSTL